jgi:flagellar hook protein FlgE
MLGAIFTCLSGMNAYKSGLDTISNNVANMNTPGFKLSDPLFRDLVYQYGGAIGNGNAAVQSRGAGVHALNSMPSLQQGELRDTGNSLDAALDGSGFFVLEQEGHRLYTRAGQFEFNKDGILVERATGARVMVSNLDSSATIFDLNNYRVFAPRATAEVALSGSLARGTSATQYTLSQIDVIDTTGTSQRLSARFIPDTADRQHWSVEVLDSDNTIIGRGDVRFNTDGTPAADGASFSVTVTPTDSEPFSVSFNFGAPDGHNGVTSITGTTTSQLQVLKQDGVKLGTITKTEFDERGQIKISYSNGEQRTPATLVIAQFDTANQLKSLGGSRFSAVEGSEPVLGAALSSGLGRIAGSKLEMSNVDLTNQFTDLIIVQRGFQGSSQITSVANEMMQQLLSMSGGR